ncbi:MAG: acyltransferase family protein [Pyrinomonadaceae bacterium]
MIEGLTAKRLRSIDALRGAAALGVVLYHAAGSLPAPSSFIERWTVRPVQAMASFGYVGVFLFFVISGFCIHLQWARGRMAGNPAPVQFLAFWKRRARRLYPPYLAALALYLLIEAFTTHLKLNSFFAWDVTAHLLMLHNLDARTCYSINGVFWTLAIEEQLYLAYFVLLYLRTRWGWARTLVCCALARVVWFLFALMIKRRFDFDVPVTEAALSHWFTWALGALGVEAAIGLIKLPAWCRSLRFAVLALLSAVCLTYALPHSGSIYLHDFGWLWLHPVWGAGFFFLINYAVYAERAGQRNLRTPRLIVVLAVIGVFSYSLYLTHQLVIMESYLFHVFHLPSTLTPLLITTPACVAFAWIFFRFCERPFLARSVAHCSRIKTAELGKTVEGGASAAGLL